MKRLFAVLAILVFAAPVFAQETESAVLSIPIPSGGKVTTEMSLGREQIEAQLGMMLSLQTGKQIDLDPTQLHAALGNLETVDFAEIKLSTKYAAADMLSYFEKQVPGRRVLWNTQGKPGSGMVLIATSGGGYFGAQIKPTISKQGRLVAGTIKAVCTKGFFDPANAVRIVFPIMEQLGVTPKAPKIGK